MARQRGYTNPEVTELCRHLVTEKILPQPGMNVARAAALLGTSAVHLTKIMHGEAGAGPDVERGLADYFYEGLVDKLRAIAADRVKRVGYTFGDSTLLSFARRPGWKAAIKEAMSRSPHYSQDTWRRVGEMSWREGDPTADDLIYLADVVVRHGATMEASARRNNHDAESQVGKSSVKLRKSKK